MNPWLSFVAIVSGFALMGFVIRIFLFAKLSKLFAQTETQVDDLILEAVKNQVVLWLTLLGILLAIRWTNLQTHSVSIIDKVALGLLIVSASFAVAQLAARSIRLYSSRKSLPLPSTSLTENVVKFLILLLGALLVLSNLGISIAPLLTALGVGSLAVALALQDTLSNLFAGIYIILNQQIRVGDYIRLDSGQEGYVVDIGWRATKIRELTNNMVVIPNAKLSQSILTNYYLPEKEMSVVFQVGVSYDSDLKKVEKVTVEVAKEILKQVQGGVGQFEPFIRYHTFADSAINFSVILRVHEYTDRYLVIHEFMKRLWVRYDQQGIVIPFPQRVLWMKGGQ